MEGVRTSPSSIRRGRGVKKCGIKATKENTAESLTPKSTSTSTETTAASKTASSKTTTFCSTTKIPKERLAEIIAMVNFAGKINTMGIDDFKRLFRKIQVRGPCPHKLTKHAHELNAVKCRYDDIVCLDDSRVVLRPMPKFTGDFIHASWISHRFLEKKFICTQGPMENTVADFWRMIWQEHVELIIMLCELCEDGSEKCAPYWPTEDGESKNFNGINISNIDMQCKEDVFLTVFSVTYDGETRKLRHFQWKGWPDRLAPRHLITPYTLHGISHTVKWPTVVHCSAGIGRSGTFVMLELVYRCLRAGKERSVPSLLWDLRSQRAGAVQTFDQFLFIYYATIQRLINRGVVDPAIVSRFCKEYEARFKRKTGKVLVEWPTPTRRIIVDPALLCHAKASRAKRKKKTLRRRAKNAKKRSKQNSQSPLSSKVGSDKSKSDDTKGSAEKLHPGDLNDGLEAGKASLKAASPSSQPRDVENQETKNGHKIASTKPSKAIPSLKPKSPMASRSAETLESVGSNETLLDIASANSDTSVRASESKEDALRSKDEEYAHSTKGSKEEDKQSLKERVQPSTDELLFSKEQLRSPKEEPHRSQKELRSSKKEKKDEVESENDKKDKLERAHVVESTSFLDKCKDDSTGSKPKPSPRELKDKTPKLDQPTRAQSPLIDFFRGAHACDSDFVAQDMARFNVKGLFKKEGEDSSKKEQQNETKKDDDINRSLDDFKEEEFFIGIQKGGTVDSVYLSLPPNK